MIFTDVAGKVTFFFLAVFSSLPSFMQYYWTVILDTSKDIRQKTCSGLKN